MVREISFVQLRQLSKVKPSLFTTERDLHIFVITRLAVYVTFTVAFQMTQHAAAYLLA